MEAYVDGSHKDGKTSYGLSVRRGIVLVYEARGTVADDGTRQIAGEIGAVMALIDFLYTNPPLNGEDIVVYYDYEGLCKWAVGEWKAKCAAAITYVGAVMRIQRMLGVTFKWEKVKSHTGNPGNDRADKLATEARTLSAKIAFSDIDIILEATGSAKKKLNELRTLSPQIVSELDKYLDDIDKVFNE